MRCRECGRETWDGHHVCWRRKRGLPARLDDRARPLVCDCDQSDPRPIGGMWASTGATECAKCRRAVLTR